MKTLLLRVVALSADPTLASRLAADTLHGPFEVEQVGSMAAALESLAAGSADLLWIDSAGEAGAEALRGVTHHGALDVALIVVVEAQASVAASIDLWRSGAQEVLAPEEASAAMVGRRLRAAVERQRLQREARKAYATDLGTGLPHHQQLIEHMSHLLALREREPVPMAVLALRIEGFSSTEARYGREAANVLRRKVAVRLRAGVRASDVVATLSDDTFGVLLAAMLAPADAQRVGEKLLRALRQPFKVAGQEVAVAAALGVAQHPQDGAQPDALLGRAVGLAVSNPASGRTGLSNFVEAGGRAPSAANDEH